MNLRKKILNTVRRWDDHLHEAWGPCRILFVISNEIGLASQLPVARILAKSPQFSVRFAFDSEESKLKGIGSGEQDFIEKRKVNRRLATFRKWHYVFHTDVNRFYCRRNAVHALLPHGSAFGNTPKSEDRSLMKRDYRTYAVAQPQINLNLAVSRASIDFSFQIAAEIMSQRNKLHFAAGSPKTDQIFQRRNAPDSDRRVQFLAEMGLSPDDHIILITSHWTENSLLRTLGLDFVRSIATAFPNYKIILFGHSILWDKTRRDLGSKILEMRRQSRSLLDEFSNIRVYRNHLNASQVIDIAELVIVDYSSIIVESCAWDKPLIRLVTPQIQFENQILAQIFDDAMINFDTVESCIEAINSYLFNGDNKKQARKVLVDYFLANQGTSAISIANIVMNAGKVSGMNSPGWKRLTEMSIRYHPNAGSNI
ncbi:MAG: hypothetical protein EP347_06720 [Alphaproteobacteria bacterium]|nr:MAG: hypothetical protein EP347_06720 [Alphaproteobacteria bacterium]